MHLNPVPGGPAGYPYPEKKARAAMGATKDDMRHLRVTHLSEATHYARGVKHSVWYNDAALAVLAGLAGQKKAPPSSIPDDLATSRAKLLELLRLRAYIRPAATPEPELLVVNAQLRNPHLLLACEVTDNFRRPKTTLRVRVRETSKFVPGMKIPVRLVPGYTDLYDLTRPCPRKKGQW